MEHEFLWKRFDLAWDKFPCSGVMMKRWDLTNCSLYVTHRRHLVASFIPNAVLAILTAVGEGRGSGCGLVDWVDVKTFLRKPSLVAITMGILPGHVGVVINVIVSIGA